MSVSVLMVAEKPSLAESIAKFLSQGKMSTKRSVACNVHEYQGNFMGKPASFKVTSVMGHVFSVDFPKEYNNWHAVDPLELFDAPVNKLEANPKQHIVKHLQVEAKNIDYLVLWLDCDREGENICFEVIKVTKPFMAATGNSRKKKNIYRAKFSAVTSVEITRAMQRLSEPNEFEAKAVDVRQELDLKIGCAFTRFQTKYFQGKYGNLDSSVISYGPCQCPTLALCVKRHDEILSFEPKKYWALSASVQIVGSGGQLKLNSNRGKIWEKKKAFDIKESIKSKAPKVEDVSSERKSIQRPHALNTVEMLRMSSKLLKMSPQQTMHVAERLYMQGYISYPRTETTKYPESFDLKGALVVLTPHPLWGIYASDLLKTGFDRPEGGKDVGDHPPITPTALGSEYDLGGDTWRLYDYISRHFIATLSGNCKYNKITATISIGNEMFSINGKSVINPGFTEILHGTVEEEEETSVIPSNFTVESKLELSDVNCFEKETSPPSYLTESDLISLMEKLGIGTDASMAVHMANIVERRYVNVTGPKRFMVPTDLGIVLIHGYQKIDPELALPTLRSEMEKKIDLIAKGKEENEIILQAELETYRNKFKQFVGKIERMDELFEATFSPLGTSGKVFSKCGKCRRYMHLIETKPARLHCRTCNETYSLPNGGTIKLFKELKCPLDRFELVLFSTGSKGKGYPICPGCYNTSPFPDEVPELMSCNLCPNESCEFSLPSNWITTCPEIKCTGYLVLDSTSAPRWKLSCNNCFCVTTFNDCVKHVSMSIEEDEETNENVPSECEQCYEKEIQTRLMDVTFGKKDGREDLKGACLACNEELGELLDTKVSKLLFGRRRGGHRGRGKGRGRGRGRGRSRGKGRGKSRVRGK